MVSGNTIIIIICIVAFVFPFAFIGRKGRKKKKGLKKSLQDYAEKHSFQIDEIEVLDELALGVDNKNCVAFSTEIVGEEYAVHHVVLNDVKTCQLNRKRRDVNTSAGSESLLSQLELAFYPKTKNGEVLSFVLYDENGGNRLGDELQLGVKWAEVYNKCKK